MDGSPLDMNGGRILATNGLLHEQMRSVIAETFPEAERRQAEISS
jgi:hypothetical protein